MSTEKVRPGWWSVALALVVMLGVVLGANISASAYLTSFPVNRGVNRLWQKWQMVERAEEAADYVLLGDSACGQGLKPEVLERELGGTVVNLCTLADATVINDAWMLERYIQRVGPPKKGVVVVHVFHGWNRPVEPLIAMFDQIPLQAGFWRTLTPALELDPALEQRLLAAPLTTLYDNNLSAAHVAQLGVAQLSGQDAERVSAVRDLEYVIRNDGWVPERTPRPEKVRSDTREHIAIFSERTFTLEPLSRQALEAIADLAREHNFRIYAGHSSIARDLYADPGIQRHMREIVAEIEPIFARDGRGAFVLQTPPQFEPEEMDNVDHVVGDEPVNRLSQQLAVEIISANTMLDMTNPLPQNR